MSSVLRSARAACTSAGSAPGDFRHQVHVAIRSNWRKQCVLVNYAVDSECDAFIEMRRERGIALAKPPEQITHGRRVNGHCNVPVGEVPVVAGEMHPSHWRLQSAASGMRASSSAFNTLGGDIGRSVNRIPSAPSIALAIAAMGGTIGVSPTPRTP